MFHCRHRRCIPYKKPALIGCLELNIQPFLLNKMLKYRKRETITATTVETNKNEEKKDREKMALIVCLCRVKILHILCFYQSTIIHVV